MACHLLIGSASKVCAPSLQLDRLAPMRGAREAEANARKSQADLARVCGERSHNEWLLCNSPRTLAPFRHHSRLVRGLFGSDAARTATSRRVPEVHCEHPTTKVPRLVSCRVHCRDGAQTASGYRLDRWEKRSDADLSARMGGFGTALDGVHTPLCSWSRGGIAC
jgi:hypothetical protein